MSSKIKLKLKSFKKKLLSNYFKVSGIVQEHFINAFSEFHLSLLPFKTSKPYVSTGLIHSLFLAIDYTVNVDTSKDCLLYTSRCV